MHCPDCGQQQVSTETRFCSRCGLPLLLVSEIVANRGYLVRPAEPAKLDAKKQFLSRKTGVFAGISWILILVNGE